MSDVFQLSAAEIKAVVRKHEIKRGEGVLAVTVKSSDLDRYAALVSRFVETIGASTSLTDHLSGLTTLPSSSMMLALLDQEEAWRRIESRYGLLTSVQVAELSGNTAKNKREYTSNLARRGDLLAVRRGGRTLYPGFQFIQATGRPAVGLRAILSVFAEAKWAPESAALWFTTPQGHTDDREPAEVLHEDPAKVLAAAENATVDW